MLDVWLLVSLHDRRLLTLSSFLGSASENTAEEHDATRSDCGAQQPRILENWHSFRCLSGDDASRKQFCPHISSHRRRQWALFPTERFLWIIPWWEAEHRTQASFWLFRFCSFSVSMLCVSWRCSKDEHASLGEGESAFRCVSPLQHSCRHLSKSPVVWIRSPL